MVGWGGEIKSVESSAAAGTTRRYLMSVSSRDLAAVDFTLNLWWHVCAPYLYYVVTNVRMCRLIVKPHPIAVIPIGSWYFPSVIYIRNSDYLILNCLFYVCTFIYFKEWDLSKLSKLSKWGQSSTGTVSQYLTCSCTRKGPILTVMEECITFCKGLAHWAQCLHRPPSLPSPHLPQPQDSTCWRQPPLHTPDHVKKSTLPTVTFGWGEG